MSADGEAELFTGIRAFEWDEEKNEANLRNHQIDFRDARWVIQGATLIRRSDRKGEVRYMVFGFVEGREIVVICTLRGEICRLISARRARRDERKKYHSRITRRPESRED
jgi:uncharacterized DUF497 family protein